VVEQAIGDLIHSHEFTALMNLHYTRPALSLLVEMDEAVHQEKIVAFLVPLFLPNFFLLCCYYEQW
jgi:hypothetical protein